MIETKYYSISELLKTPALKLNKSKLARLLNINRTTLIRHADDVDCENHIVIVRDGKYRFAAIKG